MKKLINILAMLMIAIGFFLLGQPYFELLGRRHQSTEAVNDFRAQAAALQASAGQESVSSRSELSQRQSSAAPPSEASSPAGSPDELLSLMEAYNQRIYQSRQAELRDVFSYSGSVSGFDDAGLMDNMAGVLTIPKMQIELPVYIGSSTENMSRGATIMNRTSMPIGGINTNCVIAAHRMGGFFGDIELMEIGDEVILQNLWETLTYRAVKIIVIDPYDIDKVKIQPGHDMITLLTCHPYWSNAARYIVYCERVSETAGESTPSSGGKTEPSHATATASAPEASQPIGKQPESVSDEELSLPDGIAYSSSQSTIQWEHILRIGGMILAAALFVVLSVFLLRRRKAPETPTPGKEPAGPSD